MTWHTRRLGDVLTLKRGHDLPNSQRLDGDVPVVSSSGVTGYHNESRATGPGIVTGRYGTLGEVFYIDKDYWPLNTALYVTDFKGNHPRFLAYLLRNSLRDLQSDKSAVPGVNRNVLHELKVQCPDSKVQERISSILMAYDDLIENKTRGIVLIEEAARALYEEWFVRLRFPGHEHTKFVRGVPSGWEPTKIAQLFTREIGGGWGQDEPLNKETEEAFVIRGTDIPKIERGELNTVGLRYHDPSRLNQRLLEINDLIFEVSGGSVNQPIGRTLFLSDILIGYFKPRIICASFCKLWRFRTREETIFFDNQIRHWRHTGELMQYQKQSASAIQNFQYAAFLEKTISLPDKRLLREFADTIEPLIKFKHTLAVQIHKLKQASDLLLPRLMSGEVVV